MKKRMINTSIWYDQKFSRITWLEKVVFQHLLLRRELTTAGVVITTVESIVALLNGDNGPNKTTPDFPRIPRECIEAALAALAARRMIRIERNGELTIWIRNFLRYQEWGPTVVSTWPGQIAEIPSGRIRGMVRKSCRSYCKARNYEMPGGL